MKENLNPNDWFNIGKEYLDLGWSIIPINGSKKPLCSWKIYQDKLATTEQLKKWSNNPTLAGFALVTGKLSGVFVLDIDEGSTFDINSLPKTPFSKTGSGGSHFFFLFPDKDRLRNSGGFQPHTDTRGEGGYAILPPSKHPSGNHYEWDSDPFSTPLSSIPASLIKKLQKPTKNENKIDEGINIFQGVEESRRNDSAARVIGKLLRQFDQKDWDTEVWSLVQSWNQNNNPPLEETELVTTFNSIKKKALEDKPLNNGKSNIAGKLVSLVLESDIKLFLNQFNEPCITSPECEFIAYVLKSKKAEQLLFKLYWDRYRKAPGAKAVTEAKNILEGTALFEKVEVRTLHNRIGSHNGSIYFDIGDNENVVHISENGWHIEKTSPILFQRFNHQKIQDLPIGGKNLKELLELVNVTHSGSQLLLLVSLVVSFLPEIPRPVLALNGAPGSSKSTLLRFFRELVDPSSVPLVTPPKSIAELAQLASHNYAVYFDNLSFVPTWLSDCICRLVTGDGYTKRELYTNDDDVLYAHKRAIGICGINQVATKPDLLDRCVIIALEIIDTSKRREESELWQAFNELKPEVLGSIFDCLSYALRVAPTLTIHSRPRLADSFRYSLAVAQFLDFSEQDLFDAYSFNTQSQHEEAIEASSVAQVVIEFMNDKDSWTGTSTELHGELKSIAETLKVKFPKTPNWVWREINEVRLNLSASGVKTERVKTTKANKIILTKTKNTSEDQIKELIEPGNSGSMEAMEEEIPF